MLVADTGSESGAEVSDVEGGGEEKTNNNKNNKITTTANLSTRQTTGCNKWRRITTLGTA